MIISRTPLRMSFVGGGSDLPAFSDRFGGAVLSTTIDKFVYVTVSRRFDSGIRVSYSKTEEVDSVDAIEHPLVRESMRMLGISGGVEITSVADIPSRGTGLGSSSTFTVGLLNALHAFQERHASAALLAQQSCEVEIDRCGEPIGRQDQYAAAFGGLNLIRFNVDGQVFVDPVICRRETLATLEQSLIAFYTGLTRRASNVLRVQSSDALVDPAKQQSMRRMAELAFVLRDELQQNNLDAFGEILHENWELKKVASGQSGNSQLDAYYDAARRAGALGGKLLGAGEGGFLVFYAHPEHFPAIAAALAPLRQVQFGFERQGSKIIFIH